MSPSYGVDRVLEEVFTYVEFVIVISGCFFTFGSFVPGDIHNVSSSVHDSNDCLGGPLHTCCTLGSIEMCEAEDADPALPSLPVPSWTIAKCRVWKFGKFGMRPRKGRKSEPGNVEHNARNTLLLYTTPLCPQVFSSSQRQERSIVVLALLDLCIRSHQR